MQDDKHHFFIGSIINNDDQIKLLRTIQKKIIKKYKLKDYHYNNKFFTNFIYLGYFSKEIASKYMDNIISHLLTSISNKFNELSCKYTDYKLTSDNSFNKIALKFIDNDNKLINIITQYLHNSAILPIYSKKINILKPTIDLIFYKKINKKIQILVPTELFNIDHLTLIKGTPVKSRSGAPSLHDQMNFEDIKKYEINLKKLNI